MSVTMKDGWLTGTLPGPGGKEYPVKHFPQGPNNALAEVKPQLLLHTTETDGYVESLQYPVQFQVGEGIIGQHRPLWAQGWGLKSGTGNEYSMQIEIVGRSQLELWLPKPDSLGPLVALMAFLHQRSFVKTALARPTNWADKLDRGPQATSTYYRRQAGLWPTTAGVYGHVDIPGNDHWDPGSLEYAQLFRMVLDVTGDSGSDEMSDYEKGMAAFATVARAGNPDKPPDTDWTSEKKQGFRDARLLYTNPPPSASISVGSHNPATVEVSGPPTTDAA
jgi:hypothetical protein